MTKERLLELNNLVISNEFKKEEYAQMDFNDAYSMFRLSVMHHKKFADDLKKLQADDSAENKEEKTTQLDKITKLFLTKADYFYRLSIEKVKAMEAFYIAYSRCTNSPYVFCEPNNMDDVVWFFTSEERVLDVVKKQAEKNVALRAVKVENKDFLKIFTALFYMGIDNILFDYGTDNMVLQLDRICRKPNFAKLENKVAAVANVELQLSSMYFLQEARKNIENSKKQNLPVLEEEMAKNLVNGTFLVPFLKADPEKGNEPENVRIPFIKGPEGAKILPLFTDISEFEKYNKDGKFSVVIVKFEKLEQFMGNADAVDVNPLGTNLYIKKELIPTFMERFA